MSGLSNSTRVIVSFTSYYHSSLGLELQKSRSLKTCIVQIYVNMESLVLLRKALKQNYNHELKAIYVTLLQPQSICLLLLFSMSMTRSTLTLV